MQAAQQTEWHTEEIRLGQNRLGLYRLRLRLGLYRQVTVSKPNLFVSTSTFEKLSPRSTKCTFKNRVSLRFSMKSSLSEIAAAGTRDNPERLLRRLMSHAGSGWSPIKKNRCHDISLCFRSWKTLFFVCLRLQRIVFASVKSCFCSENCMQF